LTTTDDDEHRVWAFDIRDVFRVALPGFSGRVILRPARGEASGQRDKIVAAAYTYAFTRLSKPP
jgi:hypothetical protein